MPAPPFQPRFPRRDFLDRDMKLHETLRALEVGARPMRALGAGANTPWIPIALAAGWTAPTTGAYWRIAQDVVQLRGSVTGPGGWVSGALLGSISYLDGYPMQTLYLLASTGDSTMTRVTIETDGQIRPNRDSASAVVNLDSLSWPRG